MNAINVIAPYRYLDMWVFDDPRVGLSAEPFVGGADTMIDRAVADLPHAADGFVMVFRAMRFQDTSSALSGVVRKAKGTFIILVNSTPKVGFAQRCFVISTRRLSVSMSR